MAHYKYLTRRIAVFLIFYISFFFYMRLIVGENTQLMIFANSLLFIIYLLSLYRIKYGLLLFIFFIPLFNSQEVPFVDRPGYIIVFLFFGLFLGFLVDNAGRPLKSLFLKVRSQTLYDPGITKALYIFTIILLISCAITIFRYSNFFPFITNNYYDLTIDLNRTGSTGAMIWTIRYFINYFMGFLFFILIFNVIENIKDIINCVISLIAATMISAGVIIYQYYFDPYFATFTAWVKAGRFNATFSDPNALGAYTVLLFPIFLGLLIYFKKWYIRLLILILFVIFFMELLFSGSRSALIGVSISLLIFIIIFIVKGIKILKRNFKSYSKIKKIIIIISISVVLILIIAFIVFLFNIPDSFVTNISAIDRMATTIRTGISYTQSHGIYGGFRSISNFRYIFWGQAVEMFKDYPITGVGHGSYIFQIPNYLEINETGFDQVDYSGSYYLQILSELGTPGILIYLFIIFLFISIVLKYFIWKKPKKPGRSEWLLVALFTSFIAMLAAQTFGPHTNFDEVMIAFWLIIGLMLSYIKIIQIKFRKYDKPLEIRSKIRFGIVERIALAVILIIFSVSFIISSLTSLSINVNQNLYDRNGDYIGWENTYGYYKEEIVEGETIRWTGIDASWVIDKKGSKMIIPMKDVNPIKPDEKLKVKIFVDNKLVKKEEIEYDIWNDVIIDIPYYTKDKFTLTLVFNRSWSPKELGINADTRQLGVRVKEYRFIE